MAIFYVYGIVLTSERYGFVGGLTLTCTYRVYVEKIEEWYTKLAKDLSINI